MTQGSTTTGELVARATYMVGNPSAWDSYDEGASAVIDQLVAALIAADEGEKLNAEFLAIDKARITTLERELEEARARFEKHSDYSIQLQRIIEAICHNRELRPDSADLHHHKMAAQYMAASQVEVERLKAVLEVSTFVPWLRDWCKSRFGKWITHNTAKGALTDLQVRAHNAAIQVEESKP